MLSWPCRAALGSPDLQALMMMSFPWSQACRIPCVSLGKVLLPGSGGQGKPCRGSEVTAGFQLPSPDAPCLAQKLSRLHKSILQTANPWWPSHKWVLKGHNPTGWLFCSLGLGVWRQGGLAEVKLVLLCPWVCGTMSWTEPQTSSPTAESPPQVPAAWLQRGFVLWD